MPSQKEIELLEQQEKAFNVAVTEVLKKVDLKTPETLLSLCQKDLQEQTEELKAISNALTKIRSRHLNRVDITLTSDEIELLSKHSGLKFNNTGEIDFVEIDSSVLNLTSEELKGYKDGLLFKKSFFENGLIHSFKDDEIINILAKFKKGSKLSVKEKNLMNECIIAILTLQPPEVVTKKYMNQTVSNQNSSEVNALLNELNEKFKNVTKEKVYEINDILDKLYKHIGIKYQLKFDAKQSKFQLSLSKIRHDSPFLIEELQKQPILSSAENIVFTL